MLPQKDEPELKFKHKQSQSMLANNWAQLRALILFSFRNNFLISNKKDKLVVGGQIKNQTITNQPKLISKQLKKINVMKQLKMLSESEFKQLKKIESQKYTNFGRIILRDIFLDMTFNKRQKMGQRMASSILQASFDKEDFYNETNAPQIIFQNSSGQKQRTYTLPVGIMRVKKLQSSKKGEFAASAKAQLFLEQIDTWLQDSQAEALVKQIQDYVAESRRSRYLFNEIQTSARIEGLFARVAQKILTSSASISIEHTNSLLLLLSLAAIEEVTVDNMRRCHLRESAIFHEERIDKRQFQRNIFQDVICSKKDHYDQFVKQDHPNTKISVQSLNEASRSKSNYTLQLKQSKQAKTAHFNPNIQFSNNQIVIEAQSTHDQETLAKDQEESKYWLYLYDLPFELSSLQCEQMTRFFSNVYSQTTEYFVYSQKQHLYAKQDSCSNVATKYENSYVGVCTGKDKKKAKEEEKQLNKWVSVYEKEKSSLRIPKSTLKIAKRLCDQAMSKLNKTSMLIKFKDQEGKKKMIQNGVRNFGLNYKNIKNIRVEEGYAKKSVIIKRVPWGCQSQQLLAVINLSLQTLGIKISLQPCIILKGFFIIRFNSMIQAVKAIKLLNLIVFQQHHLQAVLCYGACKIHKNNYVNQLMAYKDGQLRKRIGEFTVSYFNNMKENNTYSLSSLKE